MEAVDLYLEGRADIWYQCFRMLKSKFTWSEFSDAVLRRFGDRARQDEIEEKSKWETLFLPEADGVVDVIPNSLSGNLDRKTTSSEKGNFHTMTEKINMNSLCDEHVEKVVDLCGDCILFEETGMKGILGYNWMTDTGSTGAVFYDFDDIFDDFVTLKLWQDCKKLDVVVIANEGNQRIDTSWVVKATGFKGGTIFVHNNCVNVGFSSAANQELCGCSMNKAICFGWIMEFLVANVCTTLLVNGILPICCMVCYCVEDIECFVKFGCCLFGGSVELDFTKSIGGEFVSVIKNFVYPLTVNMLLLQKQKRVIITCAEDKKIDNSWDEEFTKFKGGTIFRNNYSVIYGSFWKLQGYPFCFDLELMDIGGWDMLLGINWIYEYCLIIFDKDGVQENDWLSLLAVHSDAWLLSVAFYFGSRFGFAKTDRTWQFNMINDLPTVYEVVTTAVKKQQKEKPLVTNHSSKSKTNPKVQAPEFKAKYGKPKSFLEEIYHCSIPFDLRALLIQWRSKEKAILFQALWITLKCSLSDHCTKLGVAETRSSTGIRLISFLPIVPNAYFLSRHCFPALNIH